MGRGAGRGKLALATANSKPSASSTRRPTRRYSPASTTPAKNTAFSTALLKRGKLVAPETPEEPQAVANAQETTPPPTTKANPPVTPIPGWQAPPLRYSLQTRCQSPGYPTTKTSLLEPTPKTQPAASPETSTIPQPAVNKRQTTMEANYQSQPAPKPKSFAVGAAPGLYGELAPSDPSRRSRAPLFPATTPATAPAPGPPAQRRRPAAAH